MYGVRGPSTGNNDANPPRPVDTTTSYGRLVFHILAALDEFQRELIVENTNEGLAAAKLRGRKGGRPPGLNPDKVRAAKQQHDAGANVSEIARALGVSRQSVYRFLAAAEDG